VLEISFFEGRMKKQKAKATKQKIKIAPFVAIFIFLVLGAIGISFGEPARVLQQATQICLSCIGIG
jgi:hypothetical protein